MNILALTILFAGLIHAQTPEAANLVQNTSTTKSSVKINDDKISVSLNDAINMALNYNKDILISKEELKKSEAQINEAYGNAYPMVNAEASYSRSLKLPVMFLPGRFLGLETDESVPLEIGSKNNYSASLTLSQVLFSAKVNTAIEIAKDYQQYSKHNANAVKDEVTLNVKKAFYTVLLMQNVVEVSQQSLDLAKANFANIEKLYKQGMTSEFDYLRAQVQVANTEPMLSQAKNNYTMSCNALKNLLGIDLKKNLNVMGSLDMTELPQELLENESSLALQRNNMLLGLSAQESMLEKNIKIQKADNYPTLAAFGNYQWQTQSNDYKFGDYKWAKSLMVGLQVSYPIFNGFQTKYKIEQAEIDKQKLLFTREKVEDGVKILLEDALLRMKEAKMRVDAQGKSVEQATKAVQIAELRFKSGLGTQLEFIDAQVALTSTKINRAQAIYDYLVSKSEWENISGYKNN